MGKKEKIMEQKEPSIFQKITSKISQFFKLDQNRTTGRKIASSLWAIAFGFIIALFVIYFITKRNPFYIFPLLFRPFAIKELGLKFYKLFIVFGFAGLASAIAFKAGIFNIGISGQMTAGASISFVIFIVINKRDVSGATLAGCLLISIVAGFIIAAIAGILKALLNVHEVITTIMLNWIIVRLISFIFNPDSKLFSDQQYKDYFSSTEIGVQTASFRTSDSTLMGFLIAGGILFFLLVIGIFVMTKYTTLGYKIKMLGLSKTNGKYMGVNDKLLVIMVMGVSGALAGIAGFYYYIFEENFALVQLSQPLIIGFESIAISLLALNSSFGVIFTSLLYALIYNSKVSLQRPPLFLDPDYANIITAIILYFAAISQLLMVIKPLNWIWRFSIKASNELYWLYVRENQINRAMISNNKRYRIKVLKIKLKVNIDNEKQLLEEYNKLTLAYEAKGHELLVKKHYITTLIEIAKQRRDIKSKLKEHQIILNALTKKAIAFKQKNIGKEISESEITLATQNIANIKAELSAFDLARQKEISKAKEILNAQVNFDATTYIPKEFNFEVFEESRLQKIKAVAKTANEHFDEMLGAALDFKNTDLETIKKFNDISKVKRDVAAEYFKLGKFDLRDLKQNFRAERINNSVDYKNKIQKMYAYYIKNFVLVKPELISKGVI